MQEIYENTTCVALTGKQLKTLQDGDTAYWLTRPLLAILAVRESHSLQRLNEVAMALAVSKPVKTDERPPEAAGAPAFSVNASEPEPDSTSLRAKARRSRSRIALSRWSARSGCATGK